MTMLDIDEISANLPGDLRRLDVILNQNLDFIVSPNLVVTGHMEFLIKNRVPIGHARLHAKFVIRFAEAS